MAKATPSVVLVRQGGDRNVARSIFEGQAGGTISAGHKLALDHSTTPPTATASDASAVEPAGPLVIAVEKRMDDANTPDAINAAYASGEMVRYIIPQPGDQLYVLAAVGVSLAIADLVVDGGGTTIGTFIEVAPATPDATTVAGTIKGKCLTTVTGGGAVVRFTMEVI